MNAHDAANEPAFLPFVETCQEHGISRTAAYRLADRGLIETFTLGRRRYVVMESLRSLPDRMRDMEAAA
ncbi:MAG: hypothetical protein KGM96_15430 [Acidobacteriota bacterium]|nr:hypothetical protein [Xanthomonadaceae bacterium]MDE3188903.1 hypothetical protein [Acidobacteriota bacterium]